VATADGGSGALPGALGSLPWIDERVVIALESDSRTVRNIIEHGTARLALGPTRDVVVIDAVLDRAVDLDDAPAAPAELCGPGRLGSPNRPRPVRLRRASTRPYPGLEGGRRTGGPDAHARRLLVV
jgi:hypothetical protein